MFPDNLGKMLQLVWPLMAGILLIMIGSGLQGTLLGLRASMAHFTVFTTGVVMSLYYCGYVIGCRFVPKMIETVGHVRVFAAMASVASTTILIHGLYVEPWVWGAVRIVSGFGFAGMSIVAESWLNNIATNKLRGQIFGSYIFVIYLGLFSGQFFLNLAPLDKMDLFVLISVLVSLSLLPVTLANKPAPGYEASEKLIFKKAFKRSPLAFVCVFCAGICAGTFFGIGALFAEEMGMDTAEVAAFVACYIAGSGIIPVLMGWLSDRMDRRVLLIGIALAGVIFSVFAMIWPMPYMIVFLWGGLSSSVYSVSIAYMNDQIKPSQILSTTTTLIFINALGACMGPFVMGYFLDSYGDISFYICFMLAFVLVAGVGIYRALVGDPIVVEEQGDYLIIPDHSSPGVVHIAEDD